MKSALSMAEPIRIGAPWSIISSGFIKILSIIIIINKSKICIWGDLELIFQLQMSLFVRVNPLAALGQ